MIGIDLFVAEHLVKFAYRTKNDCKHGPFFNGTRRLRDENHLTTHLHKDERSANHESSSDYMMSKRTRNASSRGFGGSNPPIS